MHPIMAHSRPGANDSIESIECHNNDIRLMN